MQDLDVVVVRVAAAIVLELILDQHLSPFKRALWPPGAGLPGDAVCPVGFYGAVDLDVRPPVELVHRGRHPDEHELDLPPGHRVLQFRAVSHGSSLFSNDCRCDVLNTANGCSVVTEGNCAAFMTRPTCSCSI